MKEKIEDIKIRNVDAETKFKAVYVLKTKGKTISDAVREMLADYASQFPKGK